MTTCTHTWLGKRKREMMGLNFISKNKNIKLSREMNTIVSHTKFPQTHFC